MKQNGWWMWRTGERRDEGVLCNVTFQLIHNGGNGAKKSSPAASKQQNPPKSCCWYLLASWLIRFKCLSPAGTFFVSDWNRKSINYFCRTSSASPYWAAKVCLSVAYLLRIIWVPKFKLCSNYIFRKSFKNLNILI